MPGKPKSGKVTINLGPKDVKAILEHPVYKSYSSYGGRDRVIGSKLYKAVAEKFSNVQEDMAEEIRAKDICYGMRDSDEWNKISAGLRERRKIIGEQYSQLNKEECEAMESLVQAAFDEAGITHFRASGFGIRVVVEENSESDKER